MEYLDKLNQSIESISNDAEKIAKISALIEKITLAANDLQTNEKKLTDLNVEVKAVAKSISEDSKKLFDSYEALSKEFAEKVANVNDNINKSIENNFANVNELIEKSNKDIKDEFSKKLADSNVIISQVNNSISNINSSLGTISNQAVTIRSDFSNYIIESKSNNKDIEEKLETIKTESINNSSIIQEINDNVSKNSKIVTLTLIASVIAVLVNLVNLFI